MPAPTKDAAIDDRLIRVVTRRLEEGKRVRRSLPAQGRIHVDRPLPFLCVHRPGPGFERATERLVTTEPSYLIASSARRLHADTARLVEAVAGVLTAQFGAFLLVEIWAGAPAAPGSDVNRNGLRPRFRIVTATPDQDKGFLDTLEASLARFRVQGLSSHVELVSSRRVHAPGLKPLLSSDAVQRLACSVVGLEVAPVYCDPDTGDVYPLVLRQIRRTLSRALKRTFYEFARGRTTDRPAHYHVLGRRAVVKAVWEVDKRLAEISDSFDFLLHVTPVNSARAWQGFQKGSFERTPTFLYRPLPLEPELLKRRLYEAPIERIEDPALYRLFREKQQELDRQITMLADLNSPRFQLGAIQLYGQVDGELLGAARDILHRVPPRTRDDTKGGFLGAPQFARAAEREIAMYREAWPEVTASVQVRGDIASGLMVSRGSLLIGADSRIPTARADALLHHEIGTHMVTYFNGRAQPFRQLYTGLAGYEALQEGLAVLAEYLVGGLSRPRLRTLAARVHAAKRVTEGMPFVETFRELNRTYEFERRTAYTVTMRVYRGGGFVKDACYLRGFLEVLRYLEKGGAVEPLYIGKIATAHVPIINELLWRGILRPPPLQPRFLTSPEVQERLARVQGGITLTEIIEREF